MALSATVVIDRLTTCAAIVTLATLMPLSLAPALAQETFRYMDPDGLYSTVVPDWTMQQRGTGPVYTSATGVSLRVMELTGGAADQVLDTVIEALPLPQGAAPAHRGEIATSAGVWHQSVFADDTGRATVVFVPAVANPPAALVFDAPSEEHLQEHQAILEAALLNFAFGEFIELDGVEASPLSEADLQELEQFTTDLLGKMGIPGASVAIVQGQEFVYTAGFGVRSQSSTALVDPTTMFMIGSATKPMTTAMMASLADQGLLDWDQPVNQVLTGFALSNPERTSEVTVADLVNGGSGVGRSDIAFMLSDVNAQGIISSIADIPMGVPGQFAYSNSMFAAGGYLAAVLAQQATGDHLRPAYFQLMRDRIFLPLGMDRTTFDLDEVVARGNVAKPHALDAIGDQVGEVPLETEQVFEAVAPAGSAWSNAEDMSKFAALILHGGMSREGRQVINPKELSIVTSSHTPIDTSQSYGLGWYLEDFHGQRVLQHGGNSIGYTSQMTVLPDANIAVVVLANEFLSDPFTEAIVSYVLELAFDLEHQDPSVWTTMSEQIRKQLAGLVAEDDISPASLNDVEAYLGLYELGVSFEMQDEVPVLNTDFASYPLFRIVSAGRHRFVAGGILGGLELSFHSPGEDAGVQVRSLLGAAVNAPEAITLKRLEEN